MINAIFREYNETTGLIGTVGYRIGQEERPASSTTPEACDLQQLLARLADMGAAHVIMEVSSHALAQQRVAGCRFTAAVMTNITGEHLDFHQTFEAYLEAKTRLFAQLGWDCGAAGPRTAILNADDPCFGYLDRWSAGQKLTYGIAHQADVRAVDIRRTPRGISFQAVTFAGCAAINLSLPGRFNVYNALAAISVALAEGVCLQDIAAALSRFTGVTGRFEVVDAGQDFIVVVDYAHTPDGLENAIKTARELTDGRVITVFGCGGERDRSKRALMGEAAGRYSDFAVVTDDNPRGEDPARIVKEVEPGLKRCMPAEGYMIIHDRGEAIAAALKSARRGDLVLIAGKGHEIEQVYRDRVIAFSDQQIASDFISGTMRGRYVN